MSIFSNYVGFTPINREFQEDMHTSEQPYNMSSL